MTPGDHLPEKWRDTPETRNGRDDVDPVSPATAREHVEYWIMIYGTGTQRKGIHLPAPASTRDEPVVRCDRVVDDGRPVAKDLDVFPEGYAPERICTDCRRELARTLERGDRRAD